ncbi:2OG-Fe(II) oxygenase family protein [Sphingomonas baiyangensis]|uniref:Tetratricopeptide repeat protein n=1 Tax=Sphingomonas baiyangensis TaxID=2572576 RepID=A0A4U1L3T5_9SPHN|nr:putative 2OG-Fe(II) oxygenase [Sphingomonas baiyangensis]TKD51571.1 hypothetical protein FBR43_13010 [Sphingomonas baiyangensis]
MTNYQRILVEHAAPITRAQERALLRTAFATNPGSLVIRRKLAFMGMAADAFDEVIQLLSAIALDERQYNDNLILAEAHLAREEFDDTRLAAAAASLAIAIAGDRHERAAALATRGRAEVRLGDIEAARTTFEEALELDPANKNACKRLVSLHLKAGDCRGVLELIDDLAKRGSLHSRALAARTLALARLGDIEAARTSVNHAVFRHRQQLPTPPGWPSLAAFNAALALELLDHPGLTYDRYGTASERTWRIDEPLAGGRPLVKVLVSLLAKAVDAYIDRLPRIDHPWISARPERGILHSWCVITESAGFETWHVHQFGWMSGVYYVDVPSSITKGSGPAGCLAFGIPEDEAGQEAAEAFGYELVRPQSGSMLLFPSHAYHRTFPHGATERRICLAFDIWPA